MIIDIKTKQFFYCKETDCNRLITRQTALRGLGRCKSCARKGDRNPTKNKEVCLKISKALTGRKRSKETILKMKNRVYFYLHEYIFEDSGYCSYFQ